MNVKVIAASLSSREYFFSREAQVLPGALSLRDTPVSPEHLRLEAEAKILDQTCKNAYDRGFSEGTVWQKKQNLLTLKALAEVLREAEALKRKLYAEAEEQMLDLVLAVAEKVVYEEVSANRKTILTLLREAVKSVMDREGMKICLNPSDYAFIKEMKPDFFLDLDGAKNIAFEADAAIQPGGAVLETNAGEVDARLEQRIKEIKAALKIN